MSDLEAASGLVYGVALIAIAIAVAITVYSLGRVVTRATSATPEITVAVLLAVVTVTALVAASLTGSETIGTIAATGIGGLAGAVTAAYRADGGPTE